MISRFGLPQALVPVDHIERGISSENAGREKIKSVLGLMRKRANLIYSSFSAENAY